MRKIVLVAVAGGLLTLGVVVGFGLGIFVYPYWFLTDKAMETVAERETKTVIKAGKFVHVNPKDPIHWGRGGVSILQGRNRERLVHLEPDFAVGPGPRFHVYLVDRPEVASNADFHASKAIDLGRLRAFEGNQVYQVPASVDPAGVGSVVIWCKEFQILISPARLSQRTAARSG
jgi:hypothetical protein